MNTKRKAAIVTTSILQVKFFLEPLIIELNKHYDVTLIVKNDHPSIKIHSEIKIIYAPIERQIHLFKDFYALIYLIILFLKNQFAIIHSVNPKAGLLGMLAAFLTARPARIHTFQGEVWSNKSGFFRFILKTVDKITASCSNYISVISPSERNFLVEQRIFPRKKSRVIANGSICGVDNKKFKYSAESRERFRSQHGISDKAVLFLYIGRLTVDKGIIDLLEAYLLLIVNPRLISENFYLIFAGPDEDELTSTIIQTLNSKTSNYRILPYTDNPQEIIGASDVLILPSHREGLGNVILEAASMGVPSIATNIYGISDAILDNVTGLLFNLKDPYDLSAKMLTLLNDSKLRLEMGAAARTRILNYFSQELVLSETVAFYKEIELNMKRTFTSSSHV